jgi:AmmeMemoRadiSam system protein B
MKVRARSLPPGWYPAGRNQTGREIERFLGELKGAPAAAWAGIAPHAGWTFSGLLACRVWRSLPADTETVVVVGGHLAPHSGVLAAFEEGYETPLGVIEADQPLFERLQGSVTLREDHYADNTVEVQMPFLKYFYPQARAVALRVSPSEEAVRLGEAVFEAARFLKRKTAVIGSTDLTHYGSNYGFTPHGSGPQAVKWVKEVNDRRFIDALLDLRLTDVLALAAEEKSACSAGAAVTAARFAQKCGSARGNLLEYKTSYEVYPGESFVGYGAIIYPENGRPPK